MGVAISELAAGARGLVARPARRRLRHRPRPGARPPPAGRRSRRPHAPRPRRASRSARWPSASGRRYFVRRRQGRRRAVHATCRCTARRCPRPLAELVHRRRTSSRSSWRREGHANPVGINYLEKIQTPHLRLDLRRDARRRRLRPDGRGHPAEDPRRARRVRQPRAGDVSARRHRRAATATTRRCASRRATSWRATCRRSTRPQFLPIIASNTLAAHAAEEGQRPGGRLRHRGPDGRRPQRAAARQARS